MMGDGCLVTGDGCLMLGDGCLVTGDGCLVLGDGCLMTGDGCLVMGDGCMVSKKQLRFGYVISSFYRLGVLNMENACNGQPPIRPTPNAQNA